MSVSEGCMASNVPANSSVSESTLFIDKVITPVPFTSTFIFSLANSSSSPPKATKP